MDYQPLKIPKQRRMALLILAVGTPAMLTVVLLYRAELRDHRVRNVCAYTQEIHDTLERLITVPSRDPVQREELLAALGPRPDC